METNFKNRFNVIIDTNVIIASLLTSHEDSATAKVMDFFIMIKLMFIIAMIFIKNMKM